MNNYLSNLNKEVKEYFTILSKEFPEWLLEYIETPEMQRIGKISLSCGKDYTKVFDVKYFYSNLDHSVGVALIIWNFTKDKKQTLAGLFHDISVPVFKHVVDFMSKDYQNQESIEEKTAEIIMNSKEIMSLLKRDGIKLEEIIDYKIYPIADNDIPRLSADRLEYNFSAGLTLKRVWEILDIKQCYKDITILKNEDNKEELGFKTISICEKYISTVSNLWPVWISSSDKVVMQFLADIIKKMNDKEYINKDELYILSEREIINKIINCEDKYIRDSFNKFQNARTVYESDIFIENKYCVGIKVKKRYVDPLCIFNKDIKRISNISTNSKNKIDGFLNISSSKYAYFDFDFK